jgi:predicted ATPase
MIDSLRLINFKAFEDQLLQFKPLTLLSGLNSTGKSSILQSLLLLRQSYKLNLLDQCLTLKGPLIDIGTAQDAFCERANPDYIGFELVCKNGIQGIWHFEYNIQEKEKNIIKLKNLGAVNSQIYTSSLFNLGFQYLEAERVGPRPFNDMLNFQVDLSGQLGTKGEYTAHFLAITQEKNNTHIFTNKLSHPDAKSMLLIDQVEAWIREVSPGTRIKIQSNSEMGLVNIQYFYGDSNFYRATNVGFGITYTLPIIVAVLSSSPESLILVENPEAHLHPKGQAKMGELLALAASCGIQVVIETHSDHVLNGIRLAVHRRQLNHEDVKLYYFQRQNIGTDKFTTEVISPRIDKYGKIDRWPDGFFDQMEKDLMELM